MCLFWRGHLWLGQSATNLVKLIDWLKTKCVLVFPWLEPAMQFMGTENGALEFVPVSTSKPALHVLHQETACYCCLPEACKLKDDFLKIKIIVALLSVSSSALRETKEIKKERGKKKKYRNSHAKIETILRMFVTMFERASRSQMPWERYNMALL